MASCPGTVANGSPIDTSSTGAKTFTVNATDNVGNSSSPVNVVYNVVSGGGSGPSSADVGIAISAPASVATGGTLTHTITVSNGSKTVATGVVVSDPLPVTIQIVATVTAVTGKLVNSASVTANTPDNNSNNNSDTKTTTVNS